jgi:hypothetical protein
MKLRHITVALLALISISFAACETMDEQEVEYSPIYPISGEWMAYIYNADGTTKASASLFALRTYNTADNEADKAWIRLGTTQTQAIWGKVNVDVAQKLITGQAIPNNAKANNTFTITEGKIMLQASKVPSGLMADSIYVKYTTTVDGKTYIVKGHRRTRFDATE